MVLKGYLVLIKMQGNYLEYEWSIPPCRHHLSDTGHRNLFTPKATFPLKRILSPVLTPPFLPTKTCCQAQPFTVPKSPLSKSKANSEPVSLTYLDNSSAIPYISLIANSYFEPAP
ncbi:hypothetical protein CDAR_102901 [Caerostris darwini]|uniref:Uncharacterized protein n=1 Tax=Caerostris darwini TaxID=1538125 RepID=A0AAV4MK22_9ARAC|nr:hypothetical protein CDAR_102901 [Caerostris darwini]